MSHHHDEHHDHSKPHGAGKSSYDLIDPNILFENLALRPGDTMLDLGCGAGRYTLALAARKRPGGRIYAVDLWQPSLDDLQRQALEHGLTMIEPIHADARGPLPLPDRSVDLCLLGTVFHDLARDGGHTAAMDEISRVLTRSGRLAMVEFKQHDGPPGPPKDIRFSPEELVRAVVPWGFFQVAHAELGEHTYLSIFSRI